MQVCLHPGRGPPTNVLHLVQIELQMHLLCILDIQQPLPINHFVSSYILSSVFHLTCQGPFTAKFNSNTFLPSHPSPRTQVTVIIRVLFKLFVTIEVFVDKVHLWAWFVLHYWSCTGGGSRCSALRNQQLSRSLLQVEPLFCFCCVVCSLQFSGWASLFFA